MHDYGLPGSQADADALIARLCLPVIESQGYELVAAEWRRRSRGATVRLYVHRPGGITVGECQKLLRLLEPKLQVEGVVDDHTDFEVASPGLDRPLRTVSDFVRAMEHFVVVRRRSSDDPGREEMLVGKVAHVDEQDVVLVLDSQERVTVPMDEIVEGKFDVRF